MFKIGKLYDVSNESIKIEIINHEIHKIGGLTQSYPTLSFDISGFLSDKEYSFCFDLNCRLEDLLEIPRSKTVDFKSYLFYSATYFIYDGVVDLEPIFDIKVNRWLNNKFAISINFITSILSYNEDTYAGTVEFSFNLDDYLNIDS